MIAAIELILYISWIAVAIMVIATVVIPIVMCILLLRRDEE